MFWLSIAEGLHVPVIPFKEFVGSAGAVLPAQIEVEEPKLNSGVTIGLTVTLNEYVVAHCPGFGVKTYEPEFWLSTTDGDHVPLIPLLDAAGNVGTLFPAQIVSAGPKPNTGVIIGLTVTSNVPGTAHCPAPGVNIYVPVFWLSTAVGDQVPVIPLLDMVGRPGTFCPAQMVNVVPKRKAGVTFELTVTVKEAGVAHWPASGVNI